MLGVHGVGRGADGERASRASALPSASAASTASTGMYVARASSSRSRILVHARTNCRRRCRSSAWPMADAAAPAGRRPAPSAIAQASLNSVASARVATLRVTARSSGLAPRDGLGQDGLPSMPAGLLERLGRQGRVQTWRDLSGRWGRTPPWPVATTRRRTRSPAAWSRRGHRRFAPVAFRRLSGRSGCGPPRRLAAAPSGVRRPSSRTVARSASNRRTEATRLAFTAWIPVESTELRDLSTGVIRRMLHGLPLLRGGVRWAAQECSRQPQPAGGACSGAHR